MSGQRRALVVAIARYVHPMLRKLAAPTADAAALARVLGEADLGGFEVEVLTDANSYEVTQAVEALLDDAKSSDLVLLHFSCHGIKDDRGELFLAASNTVPNRLVSTAVDAGLVNRLMQYSRAQRIVLLLDCCYGGAFERGVVARAAGDVDVAAQFTQSSPGGGRGRVVITASSAMEYAFEGTTLTDDSGPTPSLFTGALVEGITSGEADRNQDGQVGLDELYDYIHDKVRARTPNQTPSKWEFGVQGDLYIARNPRRRILPARLPDELLELVAHPTASVRLAAVGDLDQLAGGHNLRLAAGARLALHELRDDDSHRVSRATVLALERTALRVTPRWVDLGQVPIGSRSLVEVRIDGGPLAQASSIEVTHQHLHTRIQGPTLTITTTADEPGPLDGQVRLSGPAGDAVVDVTGAVVAARHIATKPAPTRSHQPDPAAARSAQLSPDPPARIPAQTPETTRDRPAEPAPTSTLDKMPRQFLVTLLLFVAAAATVGNIRRRAQFGDMKGFVLNPDAKWWFILPAIASVITIAALRIPRFRMAAIGIIVGAAIAMWLLWARTTALDWGPSRLDVTLGTGLWARLFAAAAFSGAAAMLIAASPQLRARVTWRRDVAAISGACLVIAGAVWPLVHTLRHNVWLAPSAKTQTVIVLFVFLPVTVVRLSLGQRRVALVAATAFVIFVEARDAWLAVTNNITPDPDPPPTVQDLRIGYAVAVAGLLIVLAGCFVSQGLRRSAWAGTHEFRNRPQT